ncbi:TIGR04222 domain-containing membrane protein, partial [Streptomyces sp. NPDC059538]|uniref:TIGR04222 domain-containing membrane protein n=1 Tax=Streptomyces sp. NPDC059538 TaxID=3346860 RepID=UPI003673B3C4
MNLLAVAIWIAVLVSSALLITGLRRARSAPAGPAPAPALHDLSEAAFVVGGPGTVVDVALVSMLGDGRLVAGGPGIVQVRPGARAADPAERAVLQAHRGAPSGWLYQVRYTAMCDPAVQEIGDALAARGLITPPGSGLRRFRRWGLIQALVCALLFPVSMVLTFVALAVDSGSAVPFIVKVIFALVGGIVVGLVCAAGAKSRVTGAGARALRAVRSAHLNDRTPHVGNPPGGGGRGCPPGGGAGCGSTPAFPRGPPRPPPPRRGGAPGPGTRPWRSVPPGRPAG